MTEPGERRWWGRFSLAEGERGFWHVGPMKLTLTRRPKEWCVEHVASAEAREKAFFECPSERTVAGPGIVKNRFTFSESPDVVWVRPLLANRSVVVYPENPFHVTAGESITLYCSTPLWLQVEVGEDHRPLLEAATARPSDTWFGPSTREGELCYATTTAARLDRAAMPVRAHRALTELRIENQASDTLHLERVNLAVPYLSLFATADERLWTETVTLERSSGETMGRLEIGSPPSGRGVEQVTSARLKSESGGIFVRAFSALFD